MSAVTDVTAILTMLKGSAPTNAQLQAVGNLYRHYQDVDTPNPTPEQRARGVLIGMRAELIQKYRESAESAVFATALTQAHYPEEQQALIAAVRPVAIAAGDAAAAELST